MVLVRVTEIDMMSGEEVIRNLLIVSEKAAHVARACRQNECLLALLIQEKGNKEKDPRYPNDFKTLADVLIQEMIRYDLENKFPSLKGRVYGEENNSFTNTLGETITLNLNDDCSKTMQLLLKILDGNEEAAMLMSQCVHCDVCIDHVPVHCLPKDLPDVNLDDMAVWIDPIDATYEYINGVMNNDPDVISFNGLNCVSVLIGMFSRSTGKPIAGITNQPFYSWVNNRWKGRCFWGISLDNFSLTSVPRINVEKNKKKVIAVSLVEFDENRKKLENAGFELISPSGAGYKILCVILDQIDAYVLSRASTYFWDTCSCHAIIKGLNGNIWSYQESLKGPLVELCYTEKNDSNDMKNYSNKCGFIVCKDKALAQKIVDILR